MLQRQFGNIDVGAVLVRLIFFREPDDLESSTANRVANPEELCWLFQIDRINRKRVADPGREYEPERFFAE